MKYAITIFVLFFNILFGQWPLWTNPSLPVGTANTGIGLDKGELLIGSNFSSQFIDWGHGALDTTGAHEGSLNSNIGEMNFNYGLSENWNIETSLSFGIRGMDFIGKENTHASLLYKSPS